MNYWKYTISGWKPGYKDIVMAYLSQLPFEAFEEEDESIKAYAPEKNDVEQLTNGLKKIQRDFPFEFALENLPAKNWNAVWESNFDPIQVGDFCYIRAPFHGANPDVQLNIIINPKMAFGTGHHATTYMMVAMMEHQSVAGQKVLDYGCGTGILAIVAKKLGAQSVEAFDIDNWAIENTIENAALNQVEDLEVRQSNLEEWTPGAYDLILANINRNVILSSLSTLYAKLNKGGELLISGILHEDNDLVKQEAELNGFQHLQSLLKEEWTAMKLVKN